MRWDDWLIDIFLKIVTSNRATSKTRWSVCVCVCVRACVSSVFVLLLLPCLLRFLFLLSPCLVASKRYVGTSAVRGDSLQALPNILQSLLFPLVLLPLSRSNTTPHSLQHSATHSLVHSYTHSYASGDSPPLIWSSLLFVTVELLAWNGGLKVP